MYHASEMRETFGSMALAYLCGHLHNGAGVIPQMQHMHSTGVAELELSDWKKNRVFRIMSFDHDLFSFSDHKWSTDGIYVHISNPPEWRLTNPSKQVNSFNNKLKANRSSAVGSCSKVESYSSADFFQRSNHLG